MGAAIIGIGESRNYLAAGARIFAVNPGAKPAVQVVGLIALVRSIFEIEIHVVDIAQHHAQLLLSECLVPIWFADFVNTFDEGVIAGEELVGALAAAPSRAPHAILVR